MSDSVGASVSLVSQQMDLDFDFIQRNIRDLSVTAQFKHMEELEELHKMAYNNLKEQMAPGKPLAVDPQMVLDAYKAISSICMQTIETKRKSAETLIKARTVFSVPPHSTRTSNGLIDEEGDVFDEDVSQASISNETGVYGKLVETTDPEM